MKPVRLTLATILLALFSTSVQAERSLPEYSQQYHPQRDPFKDGVAAIKLATETNRRILIEVGGEWCKWCHRLDDFLNENPAIRQRLHQTFVMLKVNVSDANDNHQFLKAFPKPLGYPHMYVTEKNGAIVESKDTADFLVNGQYRQQKFTEFFNRWALQAPPLNQHTEAVH